MPETISCPICKKRNFEHILSGKDNINNIPGKFNIVKCRYCSLMLTNPRPNSKEISRYYPSNYGPYQLNTVKVTKFVNIKNKYKLIYKLLDPKTTLDLNINKKKPKILEIGSGAGNFLYELKLQHPNWHIIGTDFNQNSIKKLNRLNINSFVSDLTKLPIDSNSIDIVYGWMVIEHVHHLSKVLSEIHRVLKQNGKFVFSLPNAGSWEFNFFKQYWHALHLPNHLYHFSEKTISKILQNHNLKLIKIIHQKTISNITSSIRIYISHTRLPQKIKHLILKIFQWNSFSPIITFPIAETLSLFKQSGRITLIAKKI